MTSGSLAVFSPVALTDDVKAKVTELGGDVAYIIAPDILHHIFISEWATAYPTAKLVCPAGLPERRAKQLKDPKIGAETFSVIFTPGPDKRAQRVGSDFDADFDYEFVDAHPNRELVFYYRPERVLIEADLLFNLPPTEQYSRTPDAGRLPSSLLDRIFTSLQTTRGNLTWTRRFMWYLLTSNRASFNESLKLIDTWDFETIIPCHGDVLEGDGKDAFRKVFEWHLAAAADK